jgi:hypothetical protein
MKYAITSSYDDEPEKLIVIVQDTPLPEEDGLESYEISDEEATTIENSNSSRWFIYEGVLKSLQEIIEIQQANIISNKVAEVGVEAGKEYLREFFARKRYQVEVGGITVSDLDVRTDRFTVDRIYQSRVLAKEDATFTTDWKLGDNNFVSLDAPTLISIADGVTQHLKDSFTREKEINDLINSAVTVEDLQAITW